MKCLPSINNENHIIVLNDDNEFVYEGILRFWDAIRYNLIKIKRTDCTEYIYGLSALHYAYLELQTSFKLTDGGFPRIENCYISAPDGPTQEVFSCRGQISLRGTYVPHTQRSIEPSFDESRVLVYPEFSMQKCVDNFNNGIDMFDLNGYNIIDVNIRKCLAITEQDCCQVRLFNDLVLDQHGAEAGFQSTL